MKIVHCPNCQKPIEWSGQSLYRPFCSARCRMIDLGAWADNSYYIPSHTPPKDPLPQDSDSEE